MTIKYPQHSLKSTLSDSVSFVLRNNMQLNWYEILVRERSCASALEDVFLLAVRFVK